MALKYIVNFVDRLDIEYRIEVDSPDYSGDVIELYPGDIPLIIDYNGNADDNIFKNHVIPSAIAFQVLSTGLDIDELMYVSDASFKCRVYQSNNLYWQGFIVSDGIQEVDSGVPYDITIKAIDGLEVLDNVRMTWGDNYSPIIVNGQQSTQRCPMNAVRLSLYRPENLDNKLPIRWNSGLKNDQYPSDDMLAGRTTLNRYGDLLRFNYSALWWISNISKSSISWVYQKMGYWYINNYFNSISGTFNGNEINTEISSTQTALAYNGIEVTVILPEDTINESWYWFGKKPLGRASVRYKDTKFKENNVIPNGGFDTIISTIGGRPLYWYLKNGNNSIISSENPINDEQTGRSIQIDNSLDIISNPTPEDTYLTFGTIPLDANILFKTANFKFVWMPVSGFSLDGSGKVLDGQLKCRIKYTAYQDGVVKNLYLNEFGFWSGYGVDYSGLSIVSVYTSVDQVRVKFSGTGANAGQEYQVSYNENDPNNPTVTINEFYTFTTNYSFTDALNEIASQTGGAVSGDEVFYSVVNPTGEYAYITGSEESSSDLSFQYTNAKEGDAVAIQFRSVGNASGIKLPDPGVITPDISNVLGRLSIEFLCKAGTVQRFDDAFFTVDDNNDIYDVYVSGSKNSTEQYEMEISSGFSGNMVTSYGDDYSVTDESMFWNGGNTLTELYGRHIMDTRNRPIKIFSGDIDKLMDWGLFTLMGKTYSPLSLSINIKDRISKVVGAEFTPSSISYTVEHKSSGAN